MRSKGEVEGEVDVEKEERQRSRKGNAAAKAAEAEIEKHLADTLNRAGINVGEGPIWRTVRVAVAGESVSRNAALRDLVECRGEAVRRATSGRVGYVHVPDTGELGYGEFYRYYTRECEKDALIVDLRCNGGGYAAELLLRKLRELPFGWSVPRQGRGRPTRCPSLCPSGCVVLLVDENTCSDGEFWAEAWQRFKLGRIVGARTWGGVVEVGAADVELLDGASLSIPAVHYYASDGVGYGLENFGVEPDVVVECPPRPKEDAEDLQLAAAIREALRMLGEAGSRPKIPPPPAARLHRKATKQQLHP